jgi:hypothetical protein
METALKVNIPPAPAASSEIRHAEEKNPNLLSMDEVIDRIINYKKDEYIELYGEEEYNLNHKQVVLERTIKLETSFRNPSLPADWDSFEPAGGIKLSIDTDEIDSLVQEKFLQLRINGLLLTRSEFEQREDVAKFRKPGKDQNDDLTRLWGAEYLRKKLLGNEQYSVPRFFIIVEDGAKKIPVTVIKTYNSLLISKCDTAFAEVVVENMVDTRATCTKEKHGWLEKIGYVDYADSGNIREGRNGKFFVVDTEWKSLDGVIKIVDENLKSLDPTLVRLRTYASERFNILHPETLSHIWQKTVEVRLDL